MLVADGLKAIETDRVSLHDDFMLFPWYENEKFVP